MKKSDLKTGMRVQFRDNVGANCIVVDIEGRLYGIFGYGHARDIYGIDGGITSCDIMSVFDMPCKDEIFNFKECGAIIWERKEEKPIATIDGVEYSESTLRSIIKKAHG